MNTTTNLGRASLVAALALFVGACASGQLSDRQHATGSSSMATSADYNRVFVANSDAGTVSIVDPKAGEVAGRTDVGIEPVRMARAGDRVYVTVRGTGEVVVLTADGDSLTEQSRISVGADPFGLVASEDGDRVFAAVGMSGQVVEIDTATDSIVRRFEVPDQPRWLALHPSGQTLYVGSAFGGTWSHIDLELGEVATHTPPQRLRFNFDSEDEDMMEITLTPRVTGDLTVSPLGDWMAIPLFYVDNTTPVGSSDGPTPNGGYASGPGVGRTNPTILLVETDKDGGPSLERSRTVFAQGFVRPTPGDEFEDDFGDGRNIRSYISSVTADPTGLSVFASMEGSNAILAIPVVGNSDNGKMRHERIMVDEFGMESGFEFVDSVTIESDAGPRGITFVGRNEAFVDNWLERTASAVDAGAAKQLLKRSVLEGDFIQQDILSIGGTVESTPAVLDAEVELGRKLFFSATDSAMAAHSGGISCATCHFDGRNDGLTWTFDIGERQTPSLAGIVSETTPVTWTSDVPTVAMEVRETSRRRMGGEGASVSQSYDVEAYIDITPYPAVQVPDDAAALARGRDLFFGEAGCADCHNGAAYTNTQAYDMFGLEQVMTPALRGIAATAPYGHDGRAATLRDLVENSENWGMGKTNQLSPDQKDDLALFLSSL